MHTKNRNVDGVDTTIVARLQEMQDRYNPLVKSFLIARERLRDNPVDEVQIQLTNSQNRDGQ